MTVCGIRTEQCVETTTRVGADLGYEVDLRDRRDGDLPDRAPRRRRPGAPLEEILADPRTLPTEDIIARTEYALAGPVRQP